MSLINFASLVCIGWLFLDGSITLVESSRQCNYPPSLWCSSRHIARACQVEDQCEANVWLKQRSIRGAKINLTLYYETLCPDCKEFVKNQLNPTFLKVAMLFNIELVPYGNAREEQVGDKWKFTCQHGALECLGNLIQTCAIHINGNISKTFPFVACMEESHLAPDVSAKQCAKKLGVDYEAIANCVNSPLGNKLEHQMALKTDALIPPHTYVPWITLNGEHTDETQRRAETDLLKLICDMYKGEKPDPCLEVLTSHKCYNY